MSAQGKHGEDGIDERQVRALLSRPLALPLNAEASYETTHDDNEGDRSQCMEVIIGRDGDCYIKTLHFAHLRYRMPVIGGGVFPATHNALRILALAIEMDRKQEEA